jgi:DNA-binding CsgD family transcriptional regulator
VYSEADTAFARAMKGSMSQLQIAVELGCSVDTVSRMQREAK